MKVSVLRSGSSGNSIVVECNGQWFLIEAGISIKELSRLLHHHDLRLAQMRGVIVSHHHADHSKYVGQYAAAGIPEMDRWPVEIHSFAVPHDAPGGTFGFRIVERGTQAALAVILDAGCFNDAMREAFNASDAIVMGVDYDSDLIAQSSREASRNARTISNTGHMSNQDLAKFIREEWNGRARTIVLAHLSAGHNSPALASESVWKAVNSRVLARRDLGFDPSMRIVVSTRNRPTPLIEVTPS